MQIAAQLLAYGEAQRFAYCRLLIEDAIVSSGPCEVSAVSDESYYVSFNNEHVFVYLLRGEAEGYRGYWNEYESHAHTPIGMLRIEGDCWSGGIARLCLK
jgi:hypothetical protein